MTDAQQSRLSHRQHGAQQADRATPGERGDAAA
jgi:hypothetical protein